MLLHGKVSKFDQSAQISAAPIVCALLAPRGIHLGRRAREDERALSGHRAVSPARPPARPLAS